MVDSPFQIDPSTVIGALTLKVSQIEQVIRFYEETVGLHQQEKTKSSASLGTGGRTLLKLESKPGGKRYETYSGLYHMAFLVPSRADLSLWLKQFLSTGHRLDGASDHFVSEALYLHDPEGNGIEIYFDRPRNKWRRTTNGQLNIGTAPLDIHSLLAATTESSSMLLPDQTRMGHVHLQVENTAKAIQFYRDVLGISLMAQYPAAGFLGAGGYHHHIGINSWNSRGFASPPGDALGLKEFELILQNEAALTLLLGHIEKSGIRIEKAGSTAYLQDPSGNRILLTLADPIQ